MSYSKSPESVVEVEEQKSAAPELHPTHADSDLPDDFPPIVDRPRPGKPRSRWLLIAAIAIATGAAGFGWYSWQSGHNRPQQQAAAAQPKAIPVKLAAVETSSIQDASEFVSSLEAKRSVQIKPEAEGLVTEIFVKSGDFVEQRTSDRPHQKRQRPSWLEAIPSQPDPRSIPITPNCKQAPGQKKSPKLKPKSPKQPPISPKCDRALGPKKLVKLKPASPKQKPT